MSGETKSLGQKDVADRFYTKEIVAEKCVNFCKSIIKDKDEDILFIEPSAGKGVFLSYLDNYKAYDLFPQASNIIKADWLTLDKTSFLNQNKKIVIIGNPPFGRQNQKAIQFFNESSFANYIAFILPRSFKKPSVQAKLNLNFHLIAEKEIPFNSFIFENKDYGVNCIFQIWQKQEIKRKIEKKKITSNYFDFTKDKEKATCSVRRVGGAAGRASLNINYSEQSNYFLINKTTLTSEQFVDFLNTLTYEDACNTVGPSSLSKTELIETFELNYI